MSVLLEPGSYSTGTLLEKDLLDMFGTIAAITECDKCGVMVHQGFVEFDQELYECVQWTLEGLYDHVEETHVPDGYRFGAHEGDGADFGVWDVEDPFG